MKSFFISLFCLIILLATWNIYNNYSDEKVYNFIDTIEYGISIDIETDNWEQAKDKFENFEKNWYNYRKTACLFYSTDKINDTDYSIARAKYYIKCKDDSNSLGELYCLKEQLKFLIENEDLTIENLF